MKKKLFPISSTIFVLIISTVAYQTYDSDNIEKNVEFRSEAQQDSQVQTNESMIIQSLNNISNEQNVHSQEKIDILNQSSESYMMSNQPLVVPTSSEKN